MNPELKRNIWLNFTKQKLILAPAVILIILYIAYASGNGPGSSGTIIWQPIFSTSFVIIFILALWGFFNTSDSVVEEARENTWIFQRSSSLGAWSFTWGKLFGSCSFCWYGTLVCLPFLIVSGLQLYGFSKTANFLALFLLFIVFIESLGLLNSIHQVTNSDQSKRAIKANKMIAIILIVIFAMPFGSFMQSLLSDSNVYYVHWYSLKASNIELITISLLIFSIWTITGIYRLFRRELQYLNYPLVWLGFLIFLVFYVSGFFTLENMPEIIKERFEVSTMALWQCRLLLATFFCLVVAYLNIFIEKTDFNTLKKIFTNFKLRKLLYAPNIPVWLPTTSLTFIFMLLFLLTSDSLDTKYLSEKDTTSYSSFYVLIAFLTFIRDALIVILVNLTYTTSKKVKRALVFYLVLLYLILPFLCSVLDVHPTAFIPWASESILLGLALSSLWIFILLVVIRKKWKSLLSAQLS